LDVQGSFHASTADYLRLQDGGHFEARLPNNSLLSVAPIEAFGFWHTPVAPISVQGRGKITAADWNGGLSVPEGQTLSLIGGNLDIKPGTFFKTVLDDDSNEVTEIIRLPILSAPYGRINLASVASRGELTFGRDFLGVSSFSQLADISITENTLIQTSGEGGGNIFIRGGQFVVDNSTIEAKTLGSQDGGVIDIRAHNISLTDGTTISTRTEGSGRGASISMQATDSITASSNLINPENAQRTGIYANSGIFQQQTDDNLGDAGDITLEAKNILFPENSVISASSYGGGNGGNLTIKASEEVSFRGKPKSDSTLIESATYSENQPAGDAGNISIVAKNILLAKGSYLNSNTKGKGKGGNVILKADENVIIEGPQPSIDVDTLYPGKSGNAGNLLIEAKTISLKNRAELSGITLGEGNAGTITLNADTITLENSTIRMDTPGPGQGGTITIHANHLLKLFGVEPTDGYGSIISVATWEDGTGNAGDIIVKAQDVVISDGGVLGSSAFGAGKAGNIQLEATGTVTIVGANLAGFSSEISSDSSPMIADIIGGEGGNITIVADRLILKDGGMIAASSIAAEGLQSRKGGNITINIKKDIELSGVNPYGENAKGFGSGIYTQSKGFINNAGDAGSITLQAGSLTIRDGAVLKSSTNNHAQGGKIDIHVKGTIVITGDASHIQLQEPSDSQIEYVKRFSLTDYNQSTSGINNRSESQHERAGSGGNIELSADKLILTDKGKISTSSAGGGKAGEIRIEVNQLQLDNSAAITSESQFKNTYRFSNLAERDSQMLILGDVVEVSKGRDGKIARYINTGNLLIRIAPVYTVANIVALNELTHKYDIKNNVVEVKDDGHGQSARFAYVDIPFADVNGWVRLSDKVKASFDSIDHLQKTIGEKYDGQTFQSGDIIEIIDHDEGGKRAPFVTLNFLFPNGRQQLQIALLIQFTVTDLAAFDELTETTLLIDGAVATVTDMGDRTPSRFVYQNDAWIAFQNFHTVADIAEMNNALTLAKTGSIAEITDVGTGQPGHFIYSGREWLPLNYTSSDGLTPLKVANSSELEKRTVKPGDIVSVPDANTGKYEDFFYADGEWKKTVSGGDAGTITITARDGVLISNQSAITTEAVNAGGGGITLKTDNLVLLRDSKITTSVQKGAGDGGNLTIEGPQIIVLNNGQIIAQAYEGHGGNIRLGSKQLVKSLCSQISASSKLGIDGDVAIDSPTINLDDFLVVLPGGMTKPAQSSGCDVDDISELSTFDVKMAGDGMPETPESFME
jgi:large exoprotein involved in heme utilization and adhesion